MFKRILIAAFLAVMVTTQAFAAETAVQIKSTAPVDKEAYPSPLVPESERVGDDYFDHAEFIGCSLMSGIRTTADFTAGHFITRGGKYIKVLRFERYSSLGNRTIAEQLIYLQPEKIYIMLGINDVSGTDEVSEILHVMNLFLEEIIEGTPDSLIYLMTITPVYPKYRERNPNNTLEKILAYNEGLYDLAVQHDIYILDFYSLLADEEGNLRLEYAAKDSIHLNETGYTIIKDFIYTHTIPLED